MFKKAEKRVMKHILDQGLFTVKSEDKPRKEGRVIKTLGVLRVLEKRLV